MELSKIRSMTDEELRAYLKSLESRRSTNCTKCHKTGTYTINVQNKRVFQQKKLCSLCEECYDELLKFLNTEDILWD